MSAVAVISLVIGALGFLAVLYLIVVAFRGDPARHAEEAARAYFDEHGAWPDER